MKFEKEQAASCSRTANELPTLSSTFSSNFKSKPNFAYSQPEYEGESRFSFFSAHTRSKKGDKAVSTIKPNISHSNTSATPPQQKTEGEFAQASPNSEARQGKGKLRRRLNINRMYAACVRREKKRVKRSAAKWQQERFAARFKRKFLVSPISPFLLKSILESEAPESTESHPTSDTMVECLEEPLIEAAGEEKAESRSPRTPRASSKQRAEIQRRNEAAPYGRFLIEVPDYVYNSDDENVSIDIEIMDT